MVSRHAEMTSRNSSCQAYADGTWPRPCLGSSTSGRRLVASCYRSRFAHRLADRSGSFALFWLSWGHVRLGFAETSMRSGHLEFSVFGSRCSTGRESTPGYYPPFATSATVEVIEPSARLSASPPLAPDKINTRILPTP